MNARKWLLGIVGAFLVAGCASKSAAPADGGAADPSAAADLVTSAPEPHYTTVPATGAFSGLLPKGYEIVKSEAGEVITMGDLNGDSHADAAILIQNMEEEQGQAAILVAHAQPDGSFALGELSGNLGPEPLMSPDPGQIQIDKGVLTFHYQSMRWSTDLKFRMEKKYGDLRLIGSETENYGNAVHDGAGGCSTNYLTGQRVSNYMRWDEEQQDLVDEPEKREKVSTNLRAFKGFDEDALYDGL
jgi:hypothetical protein